MKSRPFSWLLFSALMRLFGWRWFWDADAMRFRSPWRERLVIRAWEHGEWLNAKRVEACK